MKRTAPVPHTGLLRSLALFLCCTGTTAPAAERGGLNEALAQPVSPGSIAMLFDFSSDPRVRERWAEALRDGRPESRAAAARLASVTVAASLQPEVLTALHAEADADAARELMRAAAAFGGSDVDSALFATAARLRGPTIAVLTEILGRRWSSRDQTFVWPPPSPKTPAALAHAASLAGSGPRGTEEGRETLTRMGTTALRDRNAELLYLVLEVALATGTDIDPGTLQAILRTGAQEVTCWYIARVGPRRLPAHLIEAAATPPSAESELPFGCEIVARLAERPLDRTPPARDWTSPAGRESAKRIPLDPVVVATLTPAERRKLSLALSGEPDALGSGLAIRKRAAESVQTVLPPIVDPAAPASISLLDLAAFPRGYVEDVLAATGCRNASSDAWGGAEISYKDDGRPLKAIIFQMNKALGSCQSAARILLLTALFPRDHAFRRSDAHVVFVRLDRGSLACALPPVDSGVPSAGSESAAVPVGGRIVEPRKTKNVPPVYPASARAGGVQGVVLLEAVIMPSGCVGGAMVTRHVDPALDVSALRAVADWRYTPTLLNGQPVPVIMTVSVNFRLH